MLKTILQKYFFAYGLVILSLPIATIAMAFSLYYVGCIKFPSIADGSSYHDFQGLGYTFTAVIITGLVYFLIQHLQLLKLCKYELAASSSSELGCG